MALSSFIDAIAILCGEGFITHDEHKQLAAVTELAAGRWLEIKWGLNDL
jgi:hypothetical protein